MTEILTDNWHLYPPIQTLLERGGGRRLKAVL